jgi:NADPH:quinone reductase-like Zn-dependent oxidoreductase
MRAAFFDEHGGPEVMKVDDRPDPRAGPGQVVVRVEAVALNHLDLWVRRGLPGLDVDLPFIGGSDVAGFVEEVGEGVEGWETGDRVIVNPGLWCGRCEWCARGEHSLCDDYGILGEHVDGGAAERVAVPARNLFEIPEDFPYEEAAAVPLVFQTAWRALKTRAGLRAGESVLITGASGGVSTAAVQIARLSGARVFAVTSGPEKVERVEELGANVVVDRLEEDFSSVVWEETGKRGVDVVLDSVGEAVWEDCVRCLAKRGRLVTYGATTGPDGALDIRRMFWKQIEVMGSTMATRAEFEEVMGLVFSGRLEPVIDVAWPLERIADAHERLEAGEQFGKVVLIP